MVMLIIPNHTKLHKPSVYISYMYSRLVFSVLFSRHNSQYLSDYHGCTKTLPTKFQNVILPESCRTTATVPLGLESK